jgi:predicted nucleotidyltransferase
MNKDNVKLVRLSDAELEALLKSFREFFLPEDRLWVFGSRAKMDKKGGDIDLYIETHNNDFNHVRFKEKEFIISLWNIIGEQKIDVVINMLSANKTLDIYEIAKSTGVRIL